MKALRISLLGVLAAALLVAGCGQDSPSSSTIQLSSPAVQVDGVTSPRYKCGGGTIWLPLKWGPVPGDTEELALYFGQFRSEPGGGAKGLVVPFGALITGIDPGLRGIPTNTLPPGAIPTSFRPFNSCPRARKGQSLLVELFALDHAGQVAPASVNAAFVTRLTEEALGSMRPAASSEAATGLADEALAVGRLTATYGPR